MPWFKFRRWRLRWGGKGFILMLVALLLFFYFWEAFSDDTTLWSFISWDWTSRRELNTFSSPPTLVFDTYVAGLKPQKKKATRLESDVHLSHCIQDVSICLMMKLHTNQYIFITYIHTPPPFFFEEEMSHSKIHFLNLLLRTPPKGYPTRQMTADILTT